MDKIPGLLSIFIKDKKLFSDKLKIKLAQKVLVGANLGLLIL